MKTVHSLDQGYIKRARPLDMKNYNCSFWKRISWFGKDCWNVCSVPFLNGYLGDGQMCSCLHRVHFQALGETNPSHQTQYLNSPWVIFHPSSSEVQHHFISQTRQQAAICYELLMVRAYKAEPNCRTQNYNFRIVPYSLPMEIVCRFLNSFLSPAPLEVHRAPLLSWRSAPT